VRYAAATDAAYEAGAASIAVGHTLDDQAETVLLQLIRGAGPHGVAGMRPAGRHIVRPLIEVRRSEVEAFCRALRLRPRRDPTNADTRYLRNAIRLEVLPALMRATGRDVKAPIARSARLLQQELDRLGSPPVPEPGSSVAQRVDDGYLLFLHRFPDESFQARLVAHLLRELQAPVTEAAIGAVLDLARGRPGRRRDLGGGLIAVRDREYIRLSRTSPGDRDEGRSRADHGRSSDGRPARTRTTAHPRQVAPGAGGS
jgi:tRNA(Ile)-lysidine synthase